jgi:hypothetical protein
MRILACSKTNYPSLLPDESAAKKSEQDLSTRKYKRGINVLKQHLHLKLKAKLFKRPTK